MRSTAPVFSRTSYDKLFASPERVWLAAAGLGLVYGTFFAGLLRQCFSVLSGVLSAIVPLFSSWMIGGVLAGFIAGRWSRPAGWSLAVLLVVSLFGLRAGVIGLGVFPLGLGWAVGSWFGRRGTKAAAARGLSGNRGAAGDEDGAVVGQGGALSALQAAVTVFALCGIVALTAFQVAPAAAGTEYYFGDGLGVNCRLRLARNGLFAFRWTGCGGTYDENEGAYQMDNGLLVLHPSYPNARGGFRGTPTRFLPVDWGGRSYLIPEEGMLDFCNWINQGFEPRQQIQGMYYLRRGDEEKPVSGPPSLPQQWRGQVLAKPVDGSVLAIDSKGRATVSVGRRHGIKPGMVFMTVSAQGQPVYLVVVSAEEARAKTHWGADPSEGKPQVGAKVTTRFTG